MKTFTNSVTREAVDEALVNFPFPSEKRVELTEAISTILLNNFAYLKAMLTYIRSVKHCYEADAELNKHTLQLYMESYNICAWITVGKKTLCGMKCRGDYCKVHLAKIKKK